MADPKNPGSLHEETEPIVGELTAILAKWCEGDRDAMGQVFEMVYGQLKNAARHYLVKEGPGHSLQPTALVHEAYLVFMRSTNLKFTNRAHFFWFAGKIIRRILATHAVKRKARKRGSGEAHLSLDQMIDRAGGASLSLDQILAVHEALERLAKIDPRKSQMVEMRFFAGLSMEELAALLEISPSTAKREWRLAKLWLIQHLEEKGGTDGMGTDSRDS